MDGLMQILGLILIGSGLMPGVAPTIATSSVLIGATLWFVTYYSDDDDDFKY